MKNDKFNLNIIIFEVVIIIIAIGLLYQMNLYNNNLYKSTEQRLKMLSSADKLRQSSDDLTHFARTYVITNNKIYKKQYFDTLDIRNGKKPRPLLYESIYWDLKESERKLNHPDGKKLSLKEIMIKLPFTKQELNKLKLSQFNSNDLVNLEVEAFNAMEGKYKDKNKKYTINKQINQKLAIELLHSKDYYLAKHKIMKPIDEFMIMLNQRTKKEINDIQFKININFNIFVLCLVIFIIGNIMIYRYLNNKDRKINNEKDKLLLNAHKLNDSLKDSKLELKNLNENLENKVLEKTKEITIKHNELQQYLNVIDEIQIGIFIVDKDFKVQYMNNTMIKWFGNQTGKICYSSVAGLDKPCPYCKIYDVIELQKKVYYNPETPDGQVFDIVSAPLHNKDGSISKMEVIRNVTEKNQLQNKLFKSEKLASMGEMIGNIAHQWRQPLSIITMNMNNILADLDFDEIDNNALEEYANGTIKQAVYLSKTIDDFKNFIKGDRIKEIFNLSNDINSFLHLINATAKNNNINIILNLQEDIKINGYENELIQCFINIFNNAKDILKQKDITKKLIFISTKLINNKAIITIKDNGGGIPEDILSKIFEPYFTTKHKSQGTGLGLHMTYNLIVDGMKGTIEANNVKFEYDNIKYSGAEFIITLPME